MKCQCLFLLALVASMPGIARASLNETFDSSPGPWYTDRYAPSGFASPEFFDGDNRLKHSISAADGASSRPGAYSSAFYNTQGMKLDLPAATTSMQIDLYIPGDWASTGRRMAGFWGTAVDALDAVSGYPIIEFTSDTATPRFRGWNGDGTWTDMGLPTGFAYDSWYTLVIELIGTDFVYSVGDLSLTTPADGSTAIDNVILQGHNTTDGVDYDIHWDNLKAPASVGVVPEASTIAVWSVLSLIGLGAAAYRKRHSQA